MEDERYYRECGWEKDQIGIFCASLIPYVSSMSWVRIQPDQLFFHGRRYVQVSCIALP